MTNFRVSKLKGSADDNFKFDETDRKLSKWLRNTEGKGEIARTELVKTRVCLGKC